MDGGVGNGFSHQMRRFVCSAERLRDNREAALLVGTLLMTGKLLLPAYGITQAVLEK